MEVVLCAQSVGDSLCLWDLRRGMMIRQFKQSPAFQRNCVSTLGQHFIVGASNLRFNPVTGTTKVTDLSNVIAWTFENEASHCHNAIPFPLSACQGSPCGRYVFGGTAQGKLLVWHASSGTLSHLLDLYQEVTVLRVDPQSKILAIGFSDGLIHLFSIPKILSNLGLTDIAFSLTSNRLFSTSVDQTLKIWDLHARSCLCSISFPTSLNCVAFGAIEDSLFAGGADGNIYKINMWELPSSDFGILDIHREKSADLRVCKGHKGAINAIDVNIDGSILVSASDDGSTKVWSTSNCQNISTFVKSSGPVTFAKIFLKPIPSVTGSLSNAKSKEHYPALMPLSNILTESLAHVNLKLVGTNCIKDKLSTPLQPYESDFAFPASSEVSGGAMDVENHFTLSQNYIDEVDHYAEMKKLRESNSELQVLNKDMLKNLMNDGNKYH